MRNTGGNSNQRVCRTTTYTNLVMHVTWDGWRSPSPVCRPPAHSTPLDSISTASMPRKKLYNHLHLHLHQPRVPSVFHSIGEEDEWVRRETYLVAPFASNPHTTCVTCGSQLLSKRAPLAACRSLRRCAWALSRPDPSRINAERPDGQGFAAACRLLADPGPALAAQPNNLISGPQNTLNTAFQQRKWFHCV
jgi:hypothetical protein